MKARWIPYVGWLLTFELCGVWALGSYPLWRAPGSLATLPIAALRGMSVLGGLACAACLLIMRGRSASVVAWRGPVHFVTCWINFPLFQAISQYWIRTPADAALMRIDRVLWGGRSLPEHFLGLGNTAVSDGVSTAYLLFYPMVILSVIWFTRRREAAEARRFFCGLSVLYLLGLAGYMLVPAAGPFLAFPEVFVSPVPAGPVTRFLRDLVARGATGMDVFPSLHVAVALFVTGFFWLEGRRRLAYRILALWLLPTLVGIGLATVYLRYHYGIDVLAGLLLGCWAIALAQAVHQEDSG